MSKYCDICSIYFQNEYALQGHLVGKKHLKRHQLAQIMEMSIVVSPLPKFIYGHKLLQLFAKFGTIKHHRFHQDCLTIQYCDRKSVEVVLSKPIWVHNVLLNIERRVFTNHTEKMKSAKENKSEICYENIKHIFQEETTFDNQLVTLLNTTQLTEMEVKTKYECICVHLCMILKTVFPKCEVYKFGSTRTGLGFKDCDLDIYVDIGMPIFEPNKNAPRTSWTMQKIFTNVKTILYRMNTTFSCIIPILKAKTPIIKCCYVRTNVFCDISFKNSLGIYKSDLLKHCISLDGRLKPLMMLIKYWALHFKISGTGKISSYGLMLLIIFYLQQPSINIIPPLIKLKETCQPQIINGWQVNFDKDAVLPPVTNTSSIPQLLHGFFDFYANFEFKSRVVCLLDGMVHTESEFKDTENLPQYMDRYKACVEEDDNLKLVTNLMCIQDPTELNDNALKSTPFSIIDTFQQYCELGAQVCAANSKDDGKDLLNTLFTTELKKKTTNHKFVAVICTNHLQNLNKSNTTDASTDTKKFKSAEIDYYDTICNITKDIFENVFKMQVETVTASEEAKQNTEMHCIGSQCVWRNRKMNGIVLDPSLSCLEKEAFISEQTIENNKKKATSKVNLDLTYTLKKKKLHSPKVILTVSNQNGAESVFQEFTNFAKSKLLKIIDQTLLRMQCKC
ncbi:speckle targeted PIP5K1A-regulated poly(A) polymerase-like [Colletes gigas]|uniref:speckle targeted PIP5K1A-regulated poly(A) polymerase-like n=1 Tax=Colletes gigas TaxID=935657 RepID=UPI001C9AF6DE|nr:speckle targeted PIP5K1A-regulated poly(A) polymerase-like [Colletes gigas]